METDRHERKEVVKLYTKKRWSHFVLLSTLFR